MKSFITLLASAAALLAAASTVQAQRYELSGQNVAVYNLVGSMSIERGTGNSTVVEITRSGRDANRLTVRTDAIGGVPTLRVIYPGDEVVAENMERGTNSTISVDDDGTFNRGRGGRRVRISTGRGGSDAIHAQANIIVRLPQGVALDANVAVGTIEASGTAGALDLETSAGSISSTGNRGNVNAESASGEITIQNAQGDLQLETASGGITITGATSKTINAEAASGSIRASNITADDVDLESASGSIRVLGARTPRLKAETASGDVRVELNGTLREVEISTASGSAEAVVPADFAGEVELETASGSVDIDFPITVARQRRNYVRGTIGSGGQARVSMETASGDVRLLRR
jgi:lia operon protein LiaG